MVSSSAPLGTALANQPVLELSEACWRALVLGVVQGLTEFLPISSTAHVQVVPMLLGWGDPGVATIAVIQLGSIAAIVAYFWSDLAGVLRGVAQALRAGRWGSQEARMGVAIALGTIPILLAGMAIKLWMPDYNNSPLRSLPAIAVVSIGMALLLALAELVGRRRRQLEDVQPRDGLLVGLAQALAVIPGVSRSGSTLTASLFDNWERTSAARFSFLLGIPAITLAGVVELKDALASPANGGVIPMLVGIVAAAVVSWLAIAWLLRFLQNHSTWVFVAYRLAFGIAILIWLRGTVVG
ncbi:MAG: undecaprenyl-diphosphate phosphatase [Cyanobacteriota bacterium]